MKMLCPVLVTIAILPGMVQAAETACTPQPVTITGFARATLGIFAADGTYTDKEIDTRDLPAKDIKVCAWNRERNLMRLVFLDRDIWVDPAELQLKLGDTPQDAEQVACADAPSRPAGTQSLASMGVGGKDCKKKDKGK